MLSNALKAFVCVQARLEETARILKKVEAEQRRASGSGTEAKPFGDKQPAVSMRTPAVIRHAALHVQHQPAHRLAETMPNVADAS